MTATPGSVVDKEAYEIILGENLDTFSEISVVGTNEMVRVATPLVVSCEEIKPFWITWFQNRIMVGRGSTPFVDTFMELSPNTTFEVRGISLTSSGDTLGQWIFPKTTGN